MTRLNVTVLGDSRAFDTYYVNPAYETYYGYDKTFPFLLRKTRLARTDPAFDIVHIPDHFRSGSIENNIIRLALTDPAAVILCDGIWETLLNKELFIEYAAEQIRSHRTRGGGTLDLQYSSRTLADLFLANKLSISPEKYAQRQRRIISYFRRRRRQCVWMTLPVPPPSHLDGVHHAGDYRCQPEWGECLAAINAELEPIVEAYGAVLFDLHELMEANGGASANLIDQWHFSPGFHRTIAEKLSEVIDTLSSAVQLSDDHASHRFSMPRALGDEPVVVHGDAAGVDGWLGQNPGAKVVAICIDGKGGKEVQRHTSVDVNDLAKCPAETIVLAYDEEKRQDAESELLSRLPQDKIIVYPEELGPIHNPLNGIRPKLDRG